MLTPGPKEPTVEQLCEFNRLLVDDLIELYEHGIVMKTPRYPEGRRVKVALMAIVCDHPAMVKMAGFADKNHNNAPCHRCQATQADMYSDASLSNGESL